MTKMKRFGILFAVMALVCSLCLSLAYFTDRVSASGSISTSDDAVDVEATKPDTDPTDTTDPTDPGDDWDSTPNNPDDDLQNWWNALNATALANFNPGDKLSLDAKIINSGSLDFEYRETFIITSNVTMNTSNPEFRLYDSCTKDANGAITGVGVTATETKTANKLTYITTPKDLAVGESVKSNHDLVFALTAGNAFQGATVTVDYVLEVTQDGADWTKVATATITAGGGSYSVVPKA